MTYSIDRLSNQIEKTAKFFEKKKKNRKTNTISRIELENQVTDTFTRISKKNMFTIFYVFCTEPSNFIEIF